MLKTHLRIILRNINRRLSYSLINILGLAVGIASSFVILLYVTIEKSYEELGCIEWDKNSVIETCKVDTFLNGL